MTTLENENQEETDDYPRYSLRKWEERVFGTSYEEPKNFFPISATSAFASDSAAIILSRGISHL